MKKRHVTRENTTITLIIQFELNPVHLRAESTSGGQIIDTARTKYNVRKFRLNYKTDNVHMM
jgi:hypothetical protein